MSVEISEMGRWDDERTKRCGEYIENDCVTSNAGGRKKWLSEEGGFDGASEIHFGD